VHREVEEGAHLERASQWVTLTSTLGTFSASSVTPASKSLHRLAKVITLQFFVHLFSTGPRPEKKRGGGGGVGNITEIEI